MTAEQAAAKLKDDYQLSPNHELPQVAKVIQQAIDSATAKLREANDNLFKVARKHSTENRELKLVASNQRKQLNRGRELP